MNRIIIALIFSFFALQITGTTYAQSDEPAQILITEVLYNTTGTDESEEWIELAYFGTGSLEIGNYKLGDEETAGDGEGMFRFPSGALIESGQVIVVAQTAVGFRNLYGFDPDYEFVDSDENVPDMRRFRMLASGDVALANAGDEVVLFDEQNKLADAVNYGNNTPFFRPAVSVGLLETGESIARLPAPCDTDTAADWQISQEPTPGVASQEGECRGAITVDEMLAAIPPIGTVQGEDDRSAGNGAKVTAQGVVTAIHADRNSAGSVFYTVYLQDGGDGNPRTSDGIPAYLGTDRPDVAIGDLVIVTGQITEYYGLTEFEEQGTKVDVVRSGDPLPTAVELPATGCLEIDCETLEGMRVSIESAVVVGPAFESASGCGFTVAPKEAGITRLIRHSLETDISQLIPVLAPDDTACADLPPVKVGDMIFGLTGALTYNFEQYKIIPEDLENLTYEFAPLPELQPAPLLAEGQISIASFNVENYFDTIDDTGSDAEPKPTAEELAHKQEKLARAIMETLGCPTVVGVQEVENEALLLALADRIEPMCGFLYEVSHLDSYDGRGIDNGLLSNPNVVTVNDFALMQTCTRLTTDIAGYECDAGDDPLFSRPPFRVDMSVNGRELTIYVNHFKSKRGGELETTPRRLAQANHQNDLVRAQLAADPDGIVAVIGDFNDYADSAPLQKLTDRGDLRNVLRDLPEDEQYSFNFGGASQMIDGILLSPAADAVLVETEIYHINADFPEALGEGVYTVHRAADHDLPLVILQLGEDVAATAEQEQTAVDDQPDPTPEPAVESENMSDDGENSSSWIWWLIGLVVLAVVGIGTQMRRISGRSR